MAFANTADVQKHLPDDKLALVDADVAEHLVSAERLIRGYLATRIDQVTLATWNTPATTPGLIREWTGQWAAGAFYLKRYSEDQEGSYYNTYGAKLKSEVETKLLAFLDGKLNLEELTVQVAESLEDDDFTPNDATSAVTGQGRKFTMSKEW